MRDRSNYRFINRLKLAAIESAKDSMHERKCAIAHTEAASILRYLSGSTLTGCCDRFALGHCRKPNCKLSHPIRDPSGNSRYPQPTVPEWTNGHARYMNRVLWDELWALEHKIGFLRGQLAKLAEPNKLSTRDRKRMYKRRHREQEEIIRAGRDAHAKSAAVRSAD